MGDDLDTIPWLPNVDKDGNEIPGTGGPDASLAAVEGPGQSWRPVDLGPYLRGEIHPAEPTIGVPRSDGLRFLYRGKEHAVIGEMESGKSWFALACVAAELHAGRRILYVHFEEADPTDTIGRLRALGVRDDAIAERFTFVGPDEPVPPAVLAALLDPAPSLVVLDGVNEAMSLHGWGIRDEDGAAAYRRRLVKPCTAAGAAVLSCDHVVKDRERRGRDPLGSIHKGNGITGALLMLDNADPFGRGMRGRSHLYVTKDRPGWLRHHGEAGRLPGKTFLGELVVDDTAWRTVPDLLTIWAPNPGDEDDDEQATARTIDDAVFDVVAEVAKTGADVTARKVRAVAPYGTDAVLDALERLVIAGRLTESTGPRNARIFSVPDLSGTVSATGPRTGPHREGGPGPVGDQDRAPVLRTSQDQSGPVALPARIQLSRARGWRLPPGAVSVARPSKWGNPFPLAEHGRDQAVALYRDHLRQHPELVDQARTELPGKTLACWCPPDAACHADVLAHVAAGDQP